MRTKHIFSHSAHELKKAPMMDDGVASEFENVKLPSVTNRGDASDGGHPSSKAVRESVICYFAREQGKRTQGK